MSQFNWILHEGKVYVVPCQDSSRQLVNPAVAPLLFEFNRALRLDDPRDVDERQAKTHGS